MSVSKAIRESWATRIGFILAAVGSAVGLGNVWRFPFQVGQEGGAAFLIVYLAFVVLVGFPAILIEFVVGRNTELNPVGALRDFGEDSWKYVGGVFIMIGFVILSYYSVVAGWVVRYFVDSFTGAYMTEPGAHFMSIASGLDALVFHAIFMAAVVGVVAFGVRQGIELAVKAMVPAIIVIILGLVAYAFTLDGAGAAYSYYLSPEFGAIAENWQSVLPAAAGQAFFTLSLGMGVMITYASYISEDRNLAEDGVSIIALDTGIAVIVGLFVFPILFTAGVDPAAPGAGAIFISLAGAFAELPLGWLIGAIFFAMFALAALTSGISLLEVVVAYAVDEIGMARERAAVLIGGGIFLLGIPVTYDVVLVDLYDMLAAEILLVVGALLAMGLVSWKRSEEAKEELALGIGSLGTKGDAWIWLVRVPVLLVLVVSLYLGVTGYYEYLTTDFAEFLAS